MVGKNAGSLKFRLGLHSDFIIIIFFSYKGKCDDDD